ncbi:MAG: DUF3034 family protein [Acidobacteriota bacterium]
MTAGKTWLFALMAVWGATAHAGDRLLGTGGVNTLEGAAGGGLVPWATITGTGSANQIGGTAYATRVQMPSQYRLDVVGSSVGWYDKVELSLAKWSFGLADVQPGKSIEMKVLGGKVKLLGDAVYDQDVWMPQISVGAQYKINEDEDLVKSLGAKSSRGLDLYATATKLWLGAAAGRNVIGTFTSRLTKANQFGLLGFGGPARSTHLIKFEGSLGVMLRDDLVLGAEFRNKPNNLSMGDAATDGLREESAKDVFLAWFPCRGGSVTAAWTSLGNIVGKSAQNGWYLSGQLNY